MNNWLWLLARLVVIPLAAAALSFAILPGDYLFHLQITLVYVASSVLAGQLLGWNRPDFGLWRALLWKPGWRVARSPIWQPIKTGWMGRYFVRHC